MPIAWWGTSTEDDERNCMIDHRPFSELSGANMGWLSARHHFPVDGRPDPRHAPVKALYVWNDDTFAPGTGFPEHPHKNVEIITYVRQGSVSHRDTLGNTYDIKTGDIQVMSTGSGMRHAEFNSSDEPLRIFQMWLAPNQLGGAPAYATRRFPEVDKANQLVLLASGLEEDAKTGALPLRADARLFAGRLVSGFSLKREIEAGRDWYLVLSEGKVLVDGVEVSAGDGVAISKQTSVEIVAVQDAELVVMELL